jgi:Tol biopolymer transport system component
MRRIAKTMIAIGVPLLAGCASARSVSRSAAARPILYQSQASGATEDLWSFDIASDSATRLLRGDSLSSRAVAAWNHTATQIAYVREYAGGDELYLFDPSTRGERRIGRALTKAVMFPDWSPDDRSIAVSAGVSAEFPGIVLVDVASDSVRTVRSDSVSYRCPSWAPSGNRLVVAAYRNGVSALLVLNRDGTLRDTLVRSDSTYLDCPQWSPRGKEILYTVFHGSGRSGWERPAFHSNLAVLSLDSRRIHQLTQDAGLTNYGRWSADGEWIVFQSDRASPPTTDASDAVRMLRALELYVIRRDGRGLRRLTRNTQFDAHPSW